MRAFLSGTIGLSHEGGADSLLVDDNRIVAIDSKEKIEAMLPDEGESVSLGGGLILPGFQDAHVHLYHEGRNSVRPDLGEARRLVDALDALKEYARRSDEPVLFGEYYDEMEWPENRLPTRSELDSIEKGRPLIARRVCGHIAVANGAALQRIPDGTAGVDRESGRLEEDVVFKLEQEYFPPGADSYRRAILRGQEAAFSAGVTSVHEFDIPEVFHAFQSLDKKGDLAIRVRFFCWAPVAEVVALGGSVRDGENFNLLGCKVFTDGSIGGKTAALIEPYRGGGRGELLKSPEEIAGLYEEADRAALPLALHAIGDGAIEAVLEGRRMAGAEGGAGIPRRMEHMEVLSEERAAAAAKLGFQFSMQPNFQGRWGHPGGLYEERLGPDRTARLNRTGSWIGAGYSVAFGSDGMPLDPFYGLECAVNHPHPSERISLETAVRHYTETAETFAPGGLPSGKIAPGFRADFIWMDRKPEEGEMLHRKDLRMTVAGGKTVYER